MTTRQKGNIWKQFKVFYTKEIRKKGENGELVTDTRRSGRAKSGVSAEDLQLLHERLEEHTAEQFQRDLRIEEKLHSAMSVISDGTQRQAHSQLNHRFIPGLITASDQYTTSQLGSNDNTLQYQRAIQEHKQQNERQAERIRALEAQLGSGSNNNQCTTVTDHKVKHTDRSGKHWYQIVLYCYKCGFNWTHSSGNCNKKKAGHKDDATSANKMGGSTDKCDKINWWVKPGRPGRNETVFQQNKPE